MVILSTKWSSKNASNDKKNEVRVESLSFGVSLEETGGLDLNGHG